MAPVAPLKFTEAFSISLSTRLSFGSFFDVLLMFSNHLLHFRTYSYTTFYILLTFSFPFLSQFNILVDWDFECIKVIKPRIDRGLIILAFHSRPIIRPIRPQWPAANLLLLAKMLSL
jgi:hypothetical protein